MFSLLYCMSSPSLPFYSSVSPTSSSPFSNLVVLISRPHLPFQYLGIFLFLPPSLSAPPLSHSIVFFFFSSRMLSQLSLFQTWYVLPVNDECPLPALTSLPVFCVGCPPARVSSQSLPTHLDYCRCVIGGVVWGVGGRTCAVMMLKSSRSWRGRPGTLDVVWLGEAVHLFVHSKQLLGGTASESAAYQ